MKNMDLKTTAIMREEKIELGDLKNFCGQKDIFGSEPLVFEKNENSDLVPVSLPMTQEFFGKVFDPSGPFWETYSKIGFAVKPFGLKYVAFIRGRMYFLKNIENKFLNGLGPEETFEVRNDLLFRRKKIGLANILLALSYLPDALKQFARTISLGFMINESIKNFEDFKKKTLEYHDHYSRESNFEDPLKVAEESLGLAVRAIEYTNLALLSHSLKIKFRRSEAIDNCELEELGVLAGKKKWGAIREKFGFYSLVPYDAAHPRFREDMADLERYGLPPSPASFALKWRENAKFLVARYLDIERLALGKIGKNTGLGELVFYLKISELKNAKLDDKRQINTLAVIARGRKEQFEKWEKMELPSRIILHQGKIYVPSVKSEGSISRREIYGMSVSARKKVQGAAVNINSFADYYKCKEGSIIISRTLSPNLAILFRRSEGVISEAGGALSHAALIAREMGIPCFVQTMLPEKIKDGQYIEMDGKTGIVKFLEKLSVVLPELRKKPMNRNLTAGNAVKNNILRLSNSRVSRTGKNIVWLGDVGSDSADIGVKAANLSRIFNSYPVPEGFSVAVKVFDELFKSKEFSDLAEKIENADLSDIGKIEKISFAIGKVIENIALPPEFEKELENNFVKLGSVAAVRSSSSAEDLENASFAGQFDTILNVKNIDEVKKAIRKCWASFYGVRAIVYRLENNVSGRDAGMAVIVQKMIKAKYSGVIFTVSPDSKEEILLEAVRGQGEGLVSGESSPNSYRIGRADLSLTGEKENFPADKKNIRELARMGLEIERRFGRSQDIEWCIDRAGKIWVLQSRPITASGI